jgi:putative aldouronate transport system permease protein
MDADKWFDWINIVLASLVLIVVLYPLVYILSASFSDPFEVAGGRMWLWPVRVTLEGYERLFSYREIWQGYMNTILYTVGGTMLSLVLTLPCAYALSRKDFIGRGVLMTMVMITMFISGGLIPTYINIRNLGLLDSRTLMYISGATGAFNLIVSRTFFASTIPMELQESGRIDGCSNVRLFTQIVLPLSKPIIAVMAMYFGVARWNEYFVPMIYLKTRALFPLQLFLREILIQSQVAAEMISDIELAESLAARARISAMVKYTSIIISTIPMLILYPFLQRFFIKGVMIGAIKG